MKPGTTLFGDKIIEDITFPFQVNEDIIEKIIMKNDGTKTQHLNMYL
tara:strand:- start:541 stop:681 length:141 start_codon:yes stop_codon:yes gene_type:complete